MKRISIGAVLFALLCQSVPAATKADSILALTGGVRAKFVWERWAWCDSNYNPIQAQATVTGMDALSMDFPYTQLMIFDTDEKKERYLDSQLGYHTEPRITRRGDYVTWNDKGNSCSWIMALDGKTPKSKFIDGGDYLVKAFRLDQSTGTQYVYVWSTAATPALSQIPLDASSMPIMAQKTAVYTGGWGLVSASADGKYMAGISDGTHSTNIYDVTNKTILQRHIDNGDAFGCQDNMAPDNSYRYYYLNDDHQVIHLFNDVTKGPSSTANYVDIPINHYLPEINIPNNDDEFDCDGPRWTNNVGFQTASYPLVLGDFGSALYGGQPCPIFSKTAADIKANSYLYSELGGNFVFQKFNATFTGMAGFVCISPHDGRYRDVGGEGWVTLTGTEVLSHGSRAAHSAGLPLITSSRGMVRVAFPFDGSGFISVTNSAGRIVAQTAARGSAVVRLAGNPAGAYCVNARADRGTVVGKLVVNR